MSESDIHIDEQEIRDRFDSVHECIASACARAGRSEDEITLVAVTKTFALSFIEAALSLGQRDFGENRVQELAEKAEQLPGIVGGGEIRWHMIGHVQRNKAKVVVEHADLVHGVDSERLASALDRRAREAGRVLDCLIQVNTSGEESKFGLGYDTAEKLASEFDRHEGLRLRGLMTLAAPVEDPEQVRGEFRDLRHLFERLSRKGAGMHYLSMGMSSDFEVAIEEGATHVRLGTALFGPRSRQ